MGEPWTKICSFAGRIKKNSGYCVQAGRQANVDKSALELNPDNIGPSWPPCNNIMADVMQWFTGKISSIKITPREQCLFLILMLLMAANDCLGKIGG